MRSRMLAVVAIVSSAAACAPAAPAPGPAPAPARAGVAVPPIPALLGERERLSLDAEQVAALDSIAREWAVYDAALKESLGAGKGRPPSAIKLALRRGAGPTRAALADNDVRAVRAVEQVLKPEQRRAACESRTRSEKQATALRRRAGSAGPWPWCAGVALVEAAAGEGSGR